METISTESPNNAQHENPGALRDCLLRLLRLLAKGIVRQLQTDVGNRNASDRQQ